MTNINLEDLVLYGNHPKPAARIQWKGTDVCFDFDCECGVLGHFDGYNAYFVECGVCGKVYEMPYALPLQTPPGEVWANPVVVTDF